MTQLSLSIVLTCQWQVMTAEALRTSDILQFEQTIKLLVRRRGALRGKIRDAESLITQDEGPASVDVQRCKRMYKEVEEATEELTRCRRELELLYNHVAREQGSRRVGQVALRMYGGGSIISPVADGEVSSQVLAVVELQSAVEVGKVAEELNKVAVTAVNFEDHTDLSDKQKFLSSSLRTAITRKKSARSRMLEEARKFRPYLKLSRLTLPMELSRKPYPQDHFGVV